MAVTIQMVQEDIRRNRQVMNDSWNQCLTVLGFAMLVEGVFLKTLFAALFVLVIVRAYLTASCIEGLSAVEREMVAAERARARGYFVQLHGRN